VVSPAEVLHPRDAALDAMRDLACGHAANADVNAAANVAQLGARAEQAWTTAGRPSVERPTPRMRLGINDKPKVALAA